MVSGARLWKCAAVLGSAAVLAAACSGDDGSTAADDGDATSSSTPTTTTAPTDDGGDALDLDSAPVSDATVIAGTQEVSLTGAEPGAPVTLLGSDEEPI